MRMEVSKADLVNMIKGCQPSMRQLNDFIEKKYGTYNGSYDTWTWNSDNLSKMSEDSLLKLYVTVK